jgi:hypothetical protein
MKLRTFTLAPLLLSTACFGADSDSPSAQISSGSITAKLLLPDAERGYYRGTRFDWSGVIQSLKTKDHEYFGQWFPKYDPKLHDAIMGPVEEFVYNESAVGYDEARPGGEFVRIGVGALRKPDEAKFGRFKTYEIIDGGKWTVRKGDNWMEFTHVLGDHNGYAYHYTKRIVLDKGQPRMTIQHTLKNTGRKAFTTSQYNHNFFMLDGEPTGPDASVTFPFELRPEKPFQDGLAEVQGKRVAYLKELQEGQTVSTEFQGFGKTASDYDIRVEIKKSGAGVRIQGDQPITRIVYWSIRTTLCPEAYITMEVPPGKQSRWTYTYTFYDTRGK